MAEPKLEDEKPRPLSRSHPTVTLKEKVRAKELLGFVEEREGLGLVDSEPKGMTGPLHIKKERSRSPVKGGRGRGGKTLKVVGDRSRSPAKQRRFDE